MTDTAQAIRIEAARMTAQVLAGSGADPQRVTALFWTFVVMMQPTPAQGAEPKSGNVTHLRPVNDAEPA